MFKAQWKIKTPPVSERRLCFRAVPLLASLSSTKRYTWALRDTLGTKGLLIQSSNA